VITDSQLSPLAEYGDYILTIHSAKKSILEKGPVTFSVLNTLLLHIAQKVGKMEFVNPTNKYYIQ
jgi:DNA-binding MurR/RpiR family transcriptional regulator